jgi:hypothetical protein
LIGPSDAATCWIWPSVLMTPMRAVFSMCWLEPSIVTLPSGASKVSPFEAALTFSGSVDPAF